MYEILRLPPGPGHMKKAYDVILAYLYYSTRLTWDNFYKSTKSVYMIADNCRYHGMGWISYKTCPNDMLNLIKIRPFGNTVYTLNIITFNEESVYNKTYDLIRTLIRDCMDKMIIVENVSNQMKDIINALKNNGFKAYKGTNQYSCTYYRLPSSNSIEKKFNIINPKDDLHTIDKHICLCDEDNRIAELQDKYTKNLLNKNIEEVQSQEVNICPICGCVDCCCNQNKQTVEEFLGKDTCYYNDDCKCKEN